MSLPPVPRAPATFRAAATPQVPAVATVSVTTAGGVRSAGSGTLVAKNGDYGLIVSCAHLFRDGAGEIFVHFPDGSSYHGEQVIEYDPRSDLSALVIAAPLVQPIAVAGRVPRPGERVRLVGYGPGSQASRPGTVAGYQQSAPRGPADLIEVIGQTVEGDSGGAILDERGELCGVIFGSRGGRTSGAHCLRIDDFLRDGKLRSKSPPKTQATAQPPAEVIDPKWAERIRDVEMHQTRLAKLVEAQQTAINGRFEQLESVEPPGCQCDHSDLVSQAELRTVTSRVETLAANLKTTVRASTQPAHVDTAPPAAWAKRIEETVTGGVEQYVAKRLTMLMLGCAPGWIAAAAAVVLLRRARRRGASVAERVEDDLRSTPPTSTSGKTVVVHSQSAPPPQVVERERSFVEVQVPSARLVALQWAMDEYVKRNPGARPTVETIEAFAAQYQSGMKPAKE